MKYLSEGSLKKLMAVYGKEAVRRAIDEADYIEVPDREEYDLAVKALKGINAVYEALEEGSLRVGEGSRLDNILTAMCSDGIDRVVRALGIRESDWQTRDSKFESWTFETRIVERSGKTFSEDEIISRVGEIGCGSEDPNKLYEELN